MRRALLRVYPLLGAVWLATDWVNDWFDPDQQIAPLFPMPWWVDAISLVALLTAAVYILIHGTER